MIGIRVVKKNAEATSAYLKAHKLMDKQHLVFGRREFIYFPIISPGPDARKALKRLGAIEVNERFRKRELGGDYRALLLNELGKKEYENAVKSYDLIGDTAVIDAEPRLAKRIAKVIAGINRNVKRVVNKKGAVSGIYRTRSFTNVYGKAGYEVGYRENGITVCLDIRKAFFSPRLSYERKRISESARDRENVVVMFAGVGPYAILIAKEHRGSRVVAMELNRSACAYLKRNISINKVDNVTPVVGDVRRSAKEYKAFADRIVMPLPKDSYEFLDAALEMAKKRCVMHYYAFGDKDDPYKAHITGVKGFFKERKRRVRVLFKRVVRTYSPMEVEIVIDFLVY